jgi:hypothetical protein
VALASAGQGDADAPEPGLADGFELIVDGHWNSLLRRENSSGSPMFHVKGESNPEMSRSLLNYVGPTLPE